MITASSASVTYGDTPPSITPSYSGFVNGDYGLVADHSADLLDHRHLHQPGRQLPDLLLGGLRRQLLHHLSERSITVTGAPQHLGLLGNDDLRRYGADDHPVLLGLREQ